MHQPEHKDMMYCTKTERMNATTSWRQLPFPAGGRCLAASAQKIKYPFDCK